jgi:hypothetical protein
MCHIQREYNIAEQSLNCHAIRGYRTERPHLRPLNICIYLYDDHEIDVFASHYFVVTPYNPTPSLFSHSVLIVRYKQLCLYG